MRLTKATDIWVLSLLIVWNIQGSENNIYDHHVHILSPGLIQDWKSLGMTFSRPDEAYQNPKTILDTSSVAGAFLISMAHLYTTDDFKIFCSNEEQEHRLVAAENDFIAFSVARDPGRLVGFYSVNPLRKYTFEELNRCKANPNLTGLKLHLPACGIDVGKPEHLHQLESVLAWATAHDTPVLLHLSSGEAYDPERAHWFWETVIQPHSGLELYLAHLGSVGGFNDSSANILEAFHSLQKRSTPFKATRIFFDLSGAIMGTDSEEGSATTEEQCARLSNLITRIGPSRFVFGSDYPVFDISSTRSNISKQLKLKPEDLKIILENKSPHFRSF